MTATALQLRWHLLEAGPLWLDGGGMFGVVPRVVWSKVCPPDERNRIRLAHNCVLLEHPSAGAVLIEAGSGDKLDAKNRDIFGLTDRTVCHALEEAGTPPERVKHAIVSHLHFDHAGGLTRIGPSGAAVPAFPNATIHVQRREWEDAVSNSSVMTRTYLADHLDPIRSHLMLHDSPAPMEPYTDAPPPRGAMPDTPLDERLTEVLPGVWVFRVPGHTWGQQAVLFYDERGRAVVFTPDVMPTTRHVGAAYNMAYDVEPYVSMLSRRWFLNEAAHRDWLLVIDHEPDTPLVRVRPDGKGWFSLSPEPT
jgi:glyoxylase-like metal-dependent hydrolase (beta-lactamase superfamily II)